MNLTDAMGRIDSPLAERLKEIVGQSRRYQEQLDRIVRELDQLQQQIAEMGAPGANERERAVYTAEETI
jgi:hypothetical protein